MRGSTLRAISLALLVVGLSWASAQAGGRGDDTYDAAMQAHEDERYAEAAAKFIVAYQLGYREDTAAYNAACALARAGKPDAAFLWLDKAYQAGFDLEDYLDDDRDLRSLKSDPRFAALKTKVLAGRSSRHEREGARLVQRYRELRKDAPPERFDEIGRELLAAGRYEEAAAAFTTAAAREESPATSWYNAACARALKGDKAGALSLLARAVETGFADPQHLDEDDDLDAIRGEPRFREIRQLAVELETPGYPSSWGSRRAESVREWQTALPRIEAAVKKHPQLGQAWSNLGMARLVVGQPAQAIAPFEKAAELGYRKSSSMYNVACAHARAGNKDQAFAWLERSIAAGFGDWWLLREDADLDELRGDPRFRHYLELSRKKQAERD